MMTFYIDKKTSEVFAYSPAQLAQVSRIPAIEKQLQEKEPHYITARNNLERADKELNATKEQLEVFISELSDDDLVVIDDNEEIKILTQLITDKTSQHDEALQSFRLIEVEYQELKDEYDAILPVFFEIYEHLKAVKKMTDKEVEAYTNPPVSKEQLIAEAEMKKQQLSEESEKNITILERKVRLGMATDEEKDLLNCWEIYSINVVDIDASLAPEIDWPQKP
ncbi:tail fiber assembly protein [Providencia alcalifaciens]